MSDSRKKKIYSNKTKKKKISRLDEPPYPYIYSNNNKPFMINNNYYCLDSKKCYRNPKSSWFSKKWLYNYTTESGDTELRCTDNLIRHHMNDNYLKLGDIGITKIQNYINMDPYKDRIILNLLDNYMIPFINYDPEDTVNIGHSIISPDLSLNRFSRKVENDFKQKFDFPKIRIIVWDTETTGIGDEHRIVQLALLDINNPEKKINQKFNPKTVQMSEIATLVTGITNEELSDKMFFEDYIDNLNDFIFPSKNSINWFDGAENNEFVVMIAHNSIFDESMLIKEYIFANKNLPDNIIFVDSLDIFRTWLSGNEYQVNKSTRNPLKGVFKLSTSDPDDETFGRDLYNRIFGKTMPDAHDAFADVIGLWNLLSQFFLKIWGRNELWFIAKKIIELTYISEILDTPYMMDLLESIK